jgi:Spy/CpxP family protein refolding chaperone
LKPVQLIVLVAVMVAMPVSAFAQAADTAMAASAPAKKKHKQLKYHGKNASRAIAASAAGTNDTGTQN